jgi:ATP-dependent DNA helicase RecG
VSGRGEHQSYCILLAEDVTSDAEQRLAALEATNDGFILAERDLELRGPGEFLGRRQSGLPELTAGVLLHDRGGHMAQEEAVTLFRPGSAPGMAEHALLRERVQEFWEKTGM